MAVSKAVESPSVCALQLPLQTRGDAGVNYGAKVIGQ